MRDAARVVVTVGLSTAAAAAAAAVARRECTTFVPPDICPTNRTLTLSKLTLTQVWPAEGR